MAAYTLQDGYHGPSWDPLTDDGDALRLAVKLRIGIQWWDSMPNGIAGRLDFDGNSVIMMENASDMPAMLRKSIVRAAASLGEKL